MLSIDGAVARVTLNRPQSLNALDFGMAEALDAAITAVAANHAVRVMILEGAGRAFMAGGDLKVFHRDLPGAPATADALIKLFHRIIRGMRALPVPVVAAVQGAVAGGGLGLALATDLVIAADDAKFVPAYTAIGTSPDGGTTWSLTQLLGTRRAMATLMLGDTIDAPAALAMGLINRVVPRAELAAEVMKVAQKLAAGAPGALAKVKGLVYAAATSPLDPQLEREHVGFREAAATADFREGINAFFERRPALFSGR
jgi:2-(1,2-epoxy-1,2-dihydrophenyl)acetyl-CoA isomerase